MRKKPSRQTAETQSRAVRLLWTATALTLSLTACTDGPQEDSACNLSNARWISTKDGSIFQASAVSTQRFFQCALKDASGKIIEDGAFVVPQGTNGFRYKYPDKQTLEQTLAASCSERPSMTTIRGIYEGKTVFAHLERQDALPCCFDTSMGEEEMKVFLRQNTKAISLLWVTGELAPPPLSELDFRPNSNEFAPPDDVGPLAGHLFKYSGC